MCQRWLLLGLVAACCFTLAVAAPNIVFIFADDLGWHDVSWHNEYVITPNMQELVDTGVMLEQSYVQPLCTPSRSALMTGLYPFRIGRQGRPLMNGDPTGLTLERTLFPEKLQDLGYVTHALGKWHLGFCDWAYTPTERGFNTFLGFLGGAETYFTHMHQEGYDFRDQKEVAFEANGTYSAYLIGDRAVEIIENHEDPNKPFFIYLAMQNVHSPFELGYYPDEEDPARQTLLAMVTAMDDQVGRVVKALRDSGHYDNTIIIFSSDNGGVANAGSSNYPLYGGKSTMWEGGCRGAAFIHSPLLENIPRVHEGLLHVTDWYNTLLEIGGAIDAPSNDGYFQWDALRTGTVPSPRNSFIYNLNIMNDGSAAGAIRVGDYKYLKGQHKSKNETETSYLFNIKDDPSEANNLVEEDPVRAFELEALLLAELTGLVPVDQPDTDPDSDPSNYGGVWTPGWCDPY
ncbi:arylsulfatase I-like [Homarus americanus]|uniref:Arylsulfatase I-like n=1 Tax=Homarus americanus TaxID=6706 RepID=A0A8J5N0Q7_HOMAM|nr:arylsulfatase I-like [Homarus americanus]KAG7170719.1 Arylsulfatase I-like [Homarus americanus]